MHVSTQVQTTTQRLDNCSHNYYFMWIWLSGCKPHANAAQGHQRFLLVACTMGGGIPDLVVAVSPWLGLQLHLLHKLLWWCKPVENVDPKHHHNVVVVEGAVLASKDVSLLPSPIQHCLGVAVRCLVWNSKLGMAITVGMFDCWLQGVQPCEWKGNWHQLLGNQVFRWLDWQKSEISRRDLQNHLGNLKP